ncbi:tetraacyldisaccharide 4'-kinase [Shewanella eurypsychrophilus]|uniref:Tetraacyldisaccharide 4'-kinase n=1 Tax=Shewanella eurypsychrophilus TaxID=2593656 RepID=A0ABX6V6W1_9GAMM|nr:MULTISPECIES: tetraacyldisaccharide 4'-kinase [Shewanella]QFU22302.1 tetraacyldisaccharide 4'-kinase [Shewanella sp. YLB-09]QPG57588.1 tetraacyldisaccharide 4'-kinase [Shewanella eurypsychrophilus]
MQEFVNKVWYPNKNTPLAYKVFKRLLLPLSLLFWLVSGVRRVLFKCGIKQTFALPVPVIIVGNITVGGSGKTPMVIFLIELMRKHGLKPGVISRGYGVEFEGVKSVERHMSAAEVGDEPAMIVARTAVPMVIGADRVKAAKALIHSGQVDVIISDDGLQHYRLERDIELLILDGERRFGNEMLLPSGPLREGVWRAKHVDFTIVNGKAHDGEFQMSLQPQAIQPVSASGNGTFVPCPVVAVAGIGNPQRFFNTLHEQGHTLTKCHEFEDHQKFTLELLTQVAGEQTILMTEKDAVKCRDFAKDNWWYLAVDAKLPTKFEVNLMDKLHRVIVEKEGKSDGV